MTTKSTLLIAVCLLLGALLGVALHGEPATAQVGGPQQANSARYQVSAYGGVTDRDDHLRHGCYVVDTMTGAVWQLEIGHKPRKVVDNLPLSIR
jgi:hypothetical protein